MHIFNPEFNTLKDLEPYRQQWYEDDQRRKWAELLHPKRQRQGSKPGKGKGKGKNSKSQGQRPSQHTEDDNPESTVNGDGEAEAQNYTTQSTGSVRNQPLNKSLSQQKKNPRSRKSSERSDPPLRTIVKTPEISGSMSKPSTTRSERRSERKTKNPLHRNKTFNNRCSEMEANLDRPDPKATKPREAGNQKVAITSARTERTSKPHNPNKMRTQEVSSVKKNGSQMQTGEIKIKLDVTGPRQEQELSRPGKSKTTHHTLLISMEWDNHGSIHGARGWDPTECKTTRHSQTTQVSQGMRNGTTKCWRRSAFKRR